MSWWEHKGYTGGGNVAGLLDSLSGRPAIIAGNARGVFEEVERARQHLGEMVVTYGVNDVAVYLSRLDHMVSLHTTKLVLWAELRRDGYSRPTGNVNFQLHDAGLMGPHLWNQWKDLTPTMSLSGMFAAQIAYLMGCSPIVLCGCPTDGTPRFWELQSDNHDYTRSQKTIMDEMSFKPDFKAAVRSMSGWSREYFGSL